MKRDKQLIIVRGGGDIATGTIYTLCRCGYPVLVLEAEHPSAIRRKAAFSEAVYEGTTKVEDMLCFLINNIEEASSVMGQGYPAVMVDPDCAILKELRPWALVDAILAKRNMGTHRGMADKTIALGPGFCAGEDVDLVVETMRGHNLGRIIEDGTAMANTGIPGSIAGFGRERVIYAPDDGIFYGCCEIGDNVQQGEKIAEVDSGHGRIAVEAAITGILRGIIRSGYTVVEGFKVADIDPREEELKNCFRISDKARCIAGAVLEGLLYLEKKQGR